MNATISHYTDELAKEIKETPPEYLPILLSMIRLFKKGIMLKPADESFRKGWEEVLNNEIRPVSELWEGIDAE